MKMCDKKDVDVQTFVLTIKQICPKKGRVISQSEYNQTTQC